MRCEPASDAAAMTASHVATLCLALPSNTVTIHT